MPARAPALLETKAAGEVRDAALPGLARALDVTTLCASLQPLFAPLRHVEDLKVHHVSYVPGKRANIAYRLQLLDEHGNGSVHFMSGLLRASHEFRAKAEGLRNKARTQPAWGPAFHLVEEADLILLGFPNDPKLRDLETLQPPQVSRQFAALLGVARVDSTDILRYVPGKRLVMRHVLAEGAGSFVTKNVGRGRGRKSMQVAENLWRASRSDPGAFRIPRPLGYVAASRTLVQEDLEDWTPMRLPPTGGWRAWGIRVGRGLARMHGTAQPHLPSRCVDKEREALSDALQRLVRFEPRWQPLCAQVWERARRGPGSSPAPEGPVHTAFRVTQMLERGDHVALLDLEGFRLGDPHDDLGNMIAYLRKQVLEGRQPQADVEEGVRAFLSAYADHVPWSPSEEHVDWFTAAHLVGGYAKSCVSRLEEQLDARIPALLAEGLRRFPAPRRQGKRAVAMTRPGASTPAVVGSAAGETRLPWLACMRQATDAASMREALAAHIEGETPGTRLDAVDVRYVSAVPGVELRAWYALRCITPAGTVHQRFWAGFMQTSGSAVTADGPRKSKANRRGPIEASLQIPQLGMQLWEFPADPKLAGLRRLVNEGAVRSLLAGSLDLHASAVELDLVRYVPGKRAVLRYDITPAAEREEGGDRPSGAAPSGRSVFCKVYGSRKAARRAARLAETLWNACRLQPQAMLTSRPLYMDAETASLWLCALPGSVLDASVSEEALLRMGTGLAALHGTGVSLPARWSPAVELQSARLRAQWIGTAQPDLAASLDAILRSLEDRMEGLDFGPLVPCHGSFKLNHVMWDGQEARLLDVDSALTASPWLDVANLMTHLHYLTCQQVLDPSRASRLVAAFRSGYEAVAPWSWNEAALDWCMASLLVRKQASKCVKHLHPATEAKLARILQEAWARCGGPRA